MGTPAPSKPTLGQLIAIGLDRLVHAGLYGWYVCVSILTSAVSSLLSGESGLVLLMIVTVMMDLWAAVALSRQLMLGRLTVRSSDLPATLRLTGLFCLTFVSILLLLAPVGNLLAPWGDTAIGYLVSLLLSLVFARMAFFSTALALDDPTNFRLAFEQGAAYWGQLAVVTFVTSVPVLAIVLISSGTGLSPLAVGVLQGALSAVAGIMTTAAASYLYWRHVRV